MTAQEKVFNFCLKYNINCKIEYRLLDLVSELGELSKEVLKLSDYGQQPEIHCNADLRLEWGDVLFSLLCLGNQLEIDMEEALSLVLQKYEKRFQERASIGSS